MNPGAQTARYHVGKLSTRPGLHTGSMVFPGPEERRGGRLRGNSEDGLPRPGCAPGHGVGLVFLGSGTALSPGSSWMKEGGSVHDGFGLESSSATKDVGGCADVP